MTCSFKTRLFSDLLQILIVIHCSILLQRRQKLVERLSKIAKQHSFIYKASFVTQGSTGIGEGNPRGGPKPHKSARAHLFGGVSSAQIPPAPFDPLLSTWLRRPEGRGRETRLGRRRDETTRRRPSPAPYARRLLLPDAPPPLPVSTSVLPPLLPLYRAASSRPSAAPHLDDGLRRRASEGGR